MKRISLLVLFLTIFFFNQGEANSQDLSANIMRRVNAANLDLDKAEEQIRTGKAEHAPAKLKSAQDEYDNIFNYYKGTFDPDHPTLVKLKERMDKVAAQLSKGLSQETKATDGTLTPKTNGKEGLSANIRRRLDKANSDLGIVYEAAAKGEDAESYLNRARMEYKNIFQYYKGSFDPNHPDIVALKNRIDTAEQAMKAGIAKKNATAPLESNSRAVEDLPKQMGEDLIDIASSLRTLENRLDTAGKSSNPGSYVYGVKDDLKIVSSKFDRFNANYKGQYDPEHVAYRQVKSRLKEGRNAVSKLENEKGQGQ